MEVSFLRSPLPRGRVVPAIALALGNFDGLHRGHQELFKRIKQEEHLRSGVLSFYPHPKAVLSNNPREEIFYNLITPLRARLRLLESFGLDHVFMLRFSKSLSKLSAHEFLEQFVFAPFNIQKIVVGFDWRFGRQREGDVDLLKKIAFKKAIHVEIVEEIRLGSNKIGASFVREELRNAGVSALREILGYDFSIFGRVVRGDGRGHSLGFPTANILLHRQLYPKKGVYVSRVTVQGRDYASITNIGERPTFRGATGVKVETHILDFNEDLYGKELRVSLLEFLRPEIKFSSINELVEQIRIDISLAREFFGR